MGFAFSTHDHEGGSDRCSDVVTIAFVLTPPTATG